MYQLSKAYFISLGTELGYLERMDSWIHGKLLNGSAFIFFTSSPLTNPGHVRIAFSVVELPQRGRSKAQRLGVATGWFERVTSNLSFKEVQVSSLLQCTLSSLYYPVQFHSHSQVPVFARALNPFHLPADPFQPIIMIGPGTGIAPFVGFLEHRQRRDGNETPDGGIGKSWLFFGCRHADRDHIYQ